VPSIRNNMEMDEERMNDKDAMACSLFWTAPELLRSSAQTRSIQDIVTASVKADVYAFGVIVSEVLTRTEPYFDSDFGPADVVHMVRCRIYSFTLARHTAVAICFALEIQL
jgi:serine/threonine protein kinase